MMVRKKKKEGKNNVYTEKVPQDVAKNKSRTLKSVCVHREGPSRVQFLVLQAKHSSSFSRNPSRQGPSLLARHFLQ